MSRDAPGRMLRLLALLQSRREWSGEELAARLDVTDRTVRRDVERLRALDYPVHSATGTAGGYRLDAGANVPPLLLDDDEAVAVATGLATAAGGSVAGIEESALRALDKLARVLPARLRPRLSALAEGTAAVPRRDVPRVDPATLAVLAACSRDREIVSFAYRDRAGEASLRRVEPHGVVTVMGLWYLVAFDPARDDWRIFRLDRLDDPRPTRHRAPARELPGGDPAAHVTRSLASAPGRHVATVGVARPADEVRAGLFARIPGGVTPVDPDSCTVRVTAEASAMVVQYVAGIAALGPVTSLETSDEVRSGLADLAVRLRRM